MLKAVTGSTKYIILHMLSDIMIAMDALNTCPPPSHQREVGDNDGWLQKNE